MKLKYSPYKIFLVDYYGIILTPFLTVAELQQYRAWALLYMSLHCFGLILERGGWWGVGEGGWRGVVGGWRGEGVEACHF
jgi:hypothetical protein